MSYVFGILPVLFCTSAFQRLTGSVIAALMPELAEAMRSRAMPREAPVGSGDFGLQRFYAFFFAVATGKRM